MAFLGFYCVKRILLAVNALLIIFSVVLISTGIYAKTNSIESNGILNGIIFCGFFLLFISLVGLIGASKHHQVLLFFYMLLLSICFLIQFIIACVCLGFISVDSKYDLLSHNWNNMNTWQKKEIQSKYNCCEFDQENYDKITNKLECPDKSNGPCYEYLRESVKDGLRTTGIVALIFSFTNLFGVWLAFRYRNQRDPKCNPSEFL